MDGLVDGLFDHLPWGWSTGRWRLARCVHHWWRRYTPIGISSHKQWYSGVSLVQHWCGSTMIVVSFGRMVNPGINDWRLILEITWCHGRRDRSVGGGSGATWPHGGVTFVSGQWQFGISYLLTLETLWKHKWDMNKKPLYFPGDGGSYLTKLGMFVRRFRIVS